jgi:WD40 repeat protein
MEIYPLKFAINSLSINPDSSSIICGGREILKVLSLNDFSETRNLRKGKSNLNYSTQDIAWHPKEGEWLISAAKNSCIVLWNLTKSGVGTLETIYKGHTTLVNRVKWHPNQVDVFISASHDGSLRVWDRRQQDSVKIFKCNSEGSRDVSFSDQKDYMIGAGFDSGAVHIYDLRKELAVMKINAHKRSALTIDWHPLWPDRIASGGSDKSIKIWDVTTGADIHKIQAPEPVARVKWVPGNSTMIASAQQMHDNSLYIWDIEDPYMPARIYKGHIQPIKDFVFPADTSDSIITCSEDCFLIKQSLTNYYCPKNDIPKTFLSVSPLNTVSYFTKSNHKNLLDFITLGNPREEINQHAQKYVLKGNIEDTCEINSTVSESNSGVWNAIGMLNKISSEPGYSWLHSLIEESLYETVEFYAEKGDLQTSACISSVLNLKGPMREYSELLRQLEMMIMAAKLPISHTNVEMYFKCKCGKPIEDGICSKCNNQAECSVCGGVVKGLYSWCQGCGHGGHLQHFTTWFKNKDYCPTGCGHICYGRD